MPDTILFRDTMESLYHFQRKLFKVTTLGFLLSNRLLQILPI